MYPAIIGHPAGQIFPAAPQQNYFTFHQTGMILSHSATADSSGGFAPVVITLCLISHRRFHPGSDLSNFGGARDIAHTHHPPKSRRAVPVKAIRPLKRARTPMFRSAVVLNSKLVVGPPPPKSVVQYRSYSCRGAAVQLEYLGGFVENLGTNTHW